MNQYFINNNNLESKIKEIKYSFNDIEFSFFTDLGVFSKDKIDYGSAFLTEVILKEGNGNYKTILDVGSGYGFIGIVLTKMLNTNTTFSDVNKRALHLTKMNLKKNKLEGLVIESHAYNNIENKYDLIVSNPPIRAGKKVVLEILENAIKHLNQDGELWFVIRKDAGAKSIVKNLETTYIVKNLKKSKGFYVYCAKMIDN